jgi:hypothetical protein
MEPLSPRNVNIQPKSARPSSQSRSNQLFKEPPKDHVKIPIKRPGIEPKPSTAVKSNREKNHPKDPPPTLPYPQGGSFSVISLVGLGGFAKAFKCRGPDGSVFCVKVVKRDPGHPKMREKVSVVQGLCPF